MAGRDRGILQYISPDASSSSALKRPFELSSASTPTAELTSSLLDLETGLASSLPSSSAENASKRPKSAISCYNWLQLCSSSGGYKCSVCVDAYSKGMKLNSSSHGIWVTEPMTNSIRLMEKAKKHADSEQHKAAADLIAGSQPTIIVAL